MNTYYVAELQNEKSYREAFVIKAQSRSHAKKLATKAQAFLRHSLRNWLVCKRKWLYYPPRCRKVGGAWSDLD